MSTPPSQAAHTQNSLPSQLPPPPPSMPDTSNHSTDSRGGFYCKSCGARFSSFNALEYHENLKRRAMNKTKIPLQRFSQELHLLICPIANCCFSSDDTSTMKTHLMQLYLCSYCPDNLVPESHIEPFVDSLKTPKMVR